jgi:hypothetical protein
LLAQHPVPVPSKGNAALENITQNQGIAYRKSKKFGIIVARRPERIRRQSRAMLDLGRETAKRVEDIPLL